MIRQRKARSQGRIKNTVFLLFFIIGFIVVIQLKTERDSNIFLNRESLRELELQLFMEGSEIVRLEEYYQRRNRELEDLMLTDSQENVFGLLQNQKNYALSLNGLLGFKGPGIKVSVEDADVDILPGQNPNDVVVHDEDILNIINELKIAEAEAISINNQIVMADTVIKCSGATITINGKTYGQPFVIRAIGDPTQLEAAIKSKDSYAFMVSSIYGIKISTSLEEQIEISAYRQVKNNTYLREGTN